MIKYHGYKPKKLTPRERTLRLQAAFMSTWLLHLFSRKGFRCSDEKKWDELDKMILDVLQSHDELDTSELYAFFEEHIVPKAFQML